MNSLIFLLLGTVLNLNTTVTPFDNSEFISEPIVIEMLDEQYVQDFSSADLITTVNNYMVNHLDEITHISGHYAEKTDMYYYTVYGTKGTESKFDLLEVSKKHFTSGTFYNFENPLPLVGNCRRGNGYPLWPVCQSLYCKTWTNNCLGIICPPVECLW